MTISQDKRSRHPRLLFDALADDLRARVDGEVRFDAGTRAAYSTDASNYRQVPIGVVVPRTPDAAVTAVAVCREHDVPVLSRGGGTSLAGQCCNVAVVLDWSKYCTRVESVDTGAGIAVVQPGIALDRLNDHLAPSGWMVGPKPSTHVSCTIGGMIGNNSCGSTAQKYGKMVDSIRRLEILTYDGLRMWVSETADDEFDRIVAAGGRRADIYTQLRRLRDHYADDIRARYPNIPRRVSGYNLDSLLPENNFHLAQVLVGSESTLVTVLRAELTLVPVPAANSLALLGFDSIVEAGDAVPSVLEHSPAALEGIDHRLVELEHSRRLAEKALRELPEGNAWLMVQFHGEDKQDADSKAKAMIEHLQEVTTHTKILDDPVHEKQVWAAREAGLGATAYPPTGPETHEGWEDAAVPPKFVGNYLRDFSELLGRYHFASASLYGHFGQGCVHTRIPFDLRTADGIATYRSFVEDSARLVIGYGGSLSGEHGDGQSRAELLPIMFGNRVITAFETLKAIFDPNNRMNPGKIVHPHRLDEDLRQGVHYLPLEPVTHFAYPEDDHRFSRAAARCVGVGKCRGHESGVMCPSYRATREEEHSTRGRARLLFEMLQSDVITDGWKSTAVRDALDLCLACKGCLSDCPVNVDMATYKAEFLAHHYRRRIRPRTHYSLGWIPLWAQIAALAPSLINTLTHTPALAVDEHHRFLLARMLGRIDAIDADIAAVDAQIEVQLAPFGTATARLDEIPGIGSVAAAIIVAEVGLDMSRFPTAGHLCSWAKFSPGINSSAGKSKGNGSAGHGNRYLARVLGEAALNAGRTDTFLGARYRRIAKRRGRTRAIVAVGRSILVIVWHLLSDEGSTFHDLGAEHFIRHLHPDTKKRNHIRQLEALGYSVTLTPAA